MLIVPYRLSITLPNQRAIYDKSNFSESQMTTNRIFFQKKYHLPITPLSYMLEFDKNHIFEENNHLSSID
ncbi:hypothetical protein GCM10028806_02360 [Spirosoma terrae]